MSGVLELAVAIEADFAAYPVSPDFDPSLATGDLIALDEDDDGVGERLHLLIGLRNAFPQ